MKTLVIGGTGPSGPHVVRGLLERGHEVTIFHRGVHEPPEVPDVEHVHGDPHFEGSIDAALGSRTFDVAIAMYGRVRLLAEALVGRCEQFVSIGGTPVYSGFFPVAGAPRLPIPITESHPVVEADSDDPATRFSHRLFGAERAVFTSHPRATVLRFPMIYGPNNARPHEWSFVRRARDGRPHMILPDGGVQVHTRCAARNAAAFVRAVVDHPDRAAGQVYNCGDATSYSVRDWASAIFRRLGVDVELVAIPRHIAIEASTTLLPLAGTTATHVVVSTAKACQDLDYRAAVSTDEALDELVAWYDARPELDPSTSPSFTDRFDYATEDALIERYRLAADRIVDDVPQYAASPVHSMPHPTQPGARDHRGR